MAARGRHREGRPAEGHRSRIGREARDEKQRNGQRGSECEVHPDLRFEVIREVARIIGWPVDAHGLDHQCVVNAGEKEEQRKTTAKAPYCCAGSQRARNRLTSRPALTVAPGSTRENDNRIPRSLQCGMAGALACGKVAMLVRFSFCVLTAIIAMG